jgi:hypothetical protein
MGAAHARALVPHLDRQRRQPALDDNENPFAEFANDAGLGSPLREESGGMSIAM